MTATDPAAPRAPAPAKKANPNALLMLFRKYHTWLGVAAAGFVVVIAATGIYLNHKDTFRSVLGVPHKDDHDSGGRPGLPGAAELAALGVSLPQAVEAAEPHLGGRPVERVELRPDHGRLVYKVKAVGGPEVVVDAASGAVEVKGGERPAPKPEKGTKGEKGEKGKAAKGAKAPDTTTESDGLMAASTPRGMDWGKAIKDLHTGKIGGDAGKLLVDLVAVILIGLTLSGLYLWAVPALRKRRSARQRAAAASTAG